MSEYTSRARSGGARTSLYDEITDKIMRELEAGRVPWVQPWGTARAKAPLAIPKKTPAAGPFGPRTMPPISVAPMLTAG